MKPKPLDPSDDFPLWGFGDVVTRGRTPEEAAHYLSRGGRQLGAFQASLDIRWGYAYGTTHPGDWLRRPMFWLCEALGLDPYEHGHETRAQQMDRLIEMARQLKTAL